MSYVKLSSRASWVCVPRMTGEIQFFIRRALQVGLGRLYSYTPSTCPCLRTFNYVIYILSPLLMLKLQAQALPSPACTFLYTAALPTSFDMSSLFFPPQMAPSPTVSTDKVDGAQRVVLKVRPPPPLVLHSATNRITTQLFRKPATLSDELSVSRTEANKQFTQLESTMFDIEGRTASSLL